MASEWPFAWNLGGGQSVWDFSMEPECDETETDSVPYIHRDAARAWQAFRDWCDGTAEQWMRRLVIHGRASFTEGVEFGRTLR